MASIDTFAASAARTASGSGGTVTVYRDQRNSTKDLHLALDVTAVSGVSPTLDVKVEWSMGGSTWFPVTADAFAQKTAAGTQLISVPVRAPLVRVTWTIAGTTPSFTFSVIGYSN